MDSMRYVIWTLYDMGITPPCCFPASMASSPCLLVTSQRHAGSWQGPSQHQHPSLWPPSLSVPGLLAGYQEVPDKRQGGIRDPDPQPEGQGWGRRGGGCKSPDVICLLSEFKGRPIQMRRDMTGSGLADNPCSVCNKSRRFPLSGLQFIN